MKLLISLLLIFLLGGPALSQEFFLDESAKLFKEGYHHFKNARYSASLKIFQSLVSDESFPLVDYAQYYIAESYAGLKDLLRANLERENLARRYPYSILLQPIEKIEKKFKVIQETDGATPLARQFLYNPSFRLGYYNYSRRRYRTAIRYFSKCINYGGKLAQAAYFYRGFAYGKSGNLSAALNSFRKLTKYYPKSALADDAQFWIGYYLEINGEEERASREYRLVVEHFPEGDYVDDALWRMGRLYYKDGKYSESQAAFSRAATEFPPGDKTPECIYFRAKASEKLGLREEAFRNYQILIERFPHSYYAYRAQEKVGIKSTLPEVNYPEIQNIHLSKYQALMILGLYEEALAEAVAAQLETEGEEADLADLAVASAYHALGLYREGSLLANSVIKKGNSISHLPEAWKIAYPLGYFPYVKESAKEFGVDPYLILAVMREESHFGEVVVSRARAHGLMQIIPRTGRLIAQELKINPYSTTRLFEPKLNIRMGVYYLSNLFKSFSDEILVLAGYNGGPNKVKKWLKKMNEFDADEFVESIPLLETRYYVKKVIASYFEYKRLYPEL